MPTQGRSSLSKLGSLIQAAHPPLGSNIVGICVASQDLAGLARPPTNSQAQYRFVVSVQNTVESKNSPSPKFNLV